MKGMIRERSLRERFFGRTIGVEKTGVGAYVFALHRITGLLLLFYLFLHLFVLGFVLQGTNAFDRVMELFYNPLVRAMELGLVWVVLFHTLNGVRLVLLHFFPDLNQRSLAYVVIVAPTIIALGSVPIFFFPWQ